MHPSSLLSPKGFPVSLWVIPSIPAFKQKVLLGTNKCFIINQSADKWFIFSAVQSLKSHVQRLLQKWVKKKAPKNKAVFGEDQEIKVQCVNSHWTRRGWQTCSVCEQHRAMKSTMHPKKQFLRLEITLAFCSLNSCIMQMHAQFHSLTEAAVNGVVTRNLRAHLKGWKLV